MQRAYKFGRIQQPTSASCDLREAKMPDFFDRSLGFAVNRAAYLMRGYLRDQLETAELPLTPEEGVMVARLTVTDGLRQSELADSTIREKSTVTRLLDNLVRKGLVRRENDENDRRVVRAWLTDAARDLFPSLMQVAQSVTAEATSGITAKDLQTTIRTLRRVCDNIDSLAAGTGESTDR